MTYCQDVYWSPQYGSSNEFDTLAKGRSVAKHLILNPVPGATLRGVSYNDLVERAELLTAVHDPSYLIGVWLGLFGEFPHTPRAPFYSTVGMALAAESIANGNLRAGSLSSGLHHANHDMSNGFCTLNGLAVAAEVLIRGGATRVLIVDVDAHCGGGTHSILNGRPEVGQVDIYTAPFDKYRPVNDRFTLTQVRHRSRYLPTVERSLIDWENRHGRPDVIILNAGMDPHEDDPVGGLAGIDDTTLDARERLIFSWAGDTPVVWALAGGYVGWRRSLADVAKLHHRTIHHSATA